MKKVIILLACSLASCSQPEFVTRSDMNDWFFEPLQQLPDPVPDRSPMDAEVFRQLQDSVRMLHAALENSRQEGGSAEAEVQRLRDLLESRTSFDLSQESSVVLEGVTFLTSSAELTGVSETILEKAWIALELEPAIHVEIAGYTDNVGAEDANLRLSLQRATVVRDWLVERGIAEERLTVLGRGSEDPIDTNDSQSGRAKNRRIEFHVTQKSAGEFREE